MLCCCEQKIKLLFRERFNVNERCWLRRFKVFSSLELGKHIVIDMLNVRCILLFVKFRIDTGIEVTQVLCFQELEFVCDLMHLPLLLQ